MDAIWKYEAPITNSFSVEMPVGARVLSVAVQGNAIQMWVLVNPRAQLEFRAFRWLGTGHPAPENIGRFIGTVMIQNDALVFHLFEAPK